MMSWSDTYLMRKHYAMMVARAQFSAASANSRSARGMEAVAIMPGIMQLQKALRV